MSLDERHTVKIETRHQSVPEDKRKKIWDVFNTGNEYEKKNDIMNW